MNKSSNEQHLQFNTTMKWWGWGDPKIRADFSHRLSAITYLKKHFNFTRDKIEDNFSPETVLSNLKLPSSTLTSKLVQELKSIVGETNCTIDNYSRLINSFGKSSKDLLRLRTNKIQTLTDAVVFPQTEEEIIKIMQFCKKEKIAIVPFGGGSSVVGGLEILKGNNTYIIVVNLKNLNRIIEINEENHLAHVECGIFGPMLESKLQAANYTLGHYPQSFEFSTLGGWIASRSSGQNSVGFGGIEEMVFSLKMVTPEGVIKTLDVPRGANGSSLKEILVGSEGILGIITSAHIKIKKLPKIKDYFMYALKDFSLGKEISKKIMQQNIPVSLIRVSDEDETEGMFSLSASHSGKIGTFLNKIVKKILKFAMKLNGINPSRFSSLLIGIETSSESEQREIKVKIENLINQHRSIITLGTSPGKRWLKERFHLPYLRDELMSNGFFIETLETATTWDNLLSLHQKVRESLISVGVRLNVATKVYTHISHHYESGASLYFTIVAQESSDPLSQWENYKIAASDAIYKNGGVISHHHGIGFEHKKHLFYSPLESNLILNIKKSFDPNGIMNPGKIVDG